MSRADYYTTRYMNGQPLVPQLIPPQHAESKRDRKRRETVNKIELLHQDSWNNRDEKFNTLYKEYHSENKAVNSQPPTSARYLLRLYPSTIERDALLEAAEVEYQYKVTQAKNMYDAERGSIEAQYWDSRDQIQQRLLSAIEDRRRKLREEKEGGDIITETLLENHNKPKPSRRMPFRSRRPSPSSRADTPSHPYLPSTRFGSPPSGTKKDDLLLHEYYIPALTKISTEDILTPNSSSLALVPPVNPVAPQGGGKRGPRGKDAANADKQEILNAPGTATALAVASGQQAPPAPKGTRGAGATGQWVLGKSLAELKRMESASQLEIESDWARIQGSTGRGRRTRGD